MCAVSFVGDHYRETLPERYPWIQPHLPGSGSPPGGGGSPWPTPSPGGAGWPVVYPTPQVSREEFDALRKEVQDALALLKKAKKYDDETGQPDCEVDEKVAALKAIAKLVGVDLSEVFKS
jgi:hypothetical protein